MLGLFFSLYRVLLPDYCQFCKKNYLPLKKLSHFQQIGFPQSHYIFLNNPLLASLKEGLLMNNTFK